jgi:hypothetical protein
LQDEEEDADAEGVDPRVRRRRRGSWCARSREGGVQARTLGRVVATVDFTASIEERVKGSTMSADMH